MSVADLLRWSSAIGGTLLFGLSLYSASIGSSVERWDRRVRFVAMGGLAALITSTSLGALGRGFRWEVGAISVIVVAALVGTIAYVVRETRARRGR